VSGKPACRPWRRAPQSAQAGDDKLEEACEMIRLTRLNHGPFLINPDLIEHLEMTPDTIITLTNGHQFMVLETADEITQKVIDYRRAILARPPQAGSTDTESKGGRA
jgi:flagellar protein FlbD